jgi:WD40 repeat protein
MSPFSRDGKSLFVAAGEGTIIWDVALHKKRLEIDGLLAAVSPDEKVLAVRSGERALRLIDVRTGKEIQPRAAHRDNVRRVAFASDGQTVATFGDYEHLRLWRWSTGEELRRIDMRHRDGLYVPISGLGFSGDGKYVAVHDTGWQLHLREAVSGKKIPVWDRDKDPEVNAWHFPHDGKTVLLAFGTDTLRLRDLGRKAEIRKVSLEPVRGIRRTQWDPSTFSPDGTLLVRAAVYEDTSPKRTFPYTQVTALAVWDTVTGKLVRKMPLTDNLHAVYDIAVSPNNRLLALAVFEAVHVWDLRTGKLVRKLPADKFSTALAFSPDSTRLAYTAPDLGICADKTPSLQLVTIQAAHGKRTFKVAVRTVPR